MVAPFSLSLITQGFRRLQNTGGLFLLAVSCLISAHSYAISIGVIGPLSGDLAAYGIPVKNAVELAAEDINKSGGINGDKLEVIALDDVCEPNTAITTANKVIGKKVVAVIGHLCSGATRSVLDLYKQAKVVVISPASTNPDLTMDGKSPHFFRTIAHDAAQADLQVKFIKEKLKVTKVAVLHDKGTYGKGLADLVKKGLSEAPGNVEVALYEGLDPKNVTYTTLVDRISKNKAEAVVFGGYHPEAAKLIKSARQKKLSMPFISGDGVRNEKLIELAGQHADGYYATAPVDTSTNTMAIQVTRDYKNKFKSEPGTFTLQAYAAVLALRQAILDAGGSSYDTLLKGLKSANTETPIGQISFDERGDVVGSGFTMYKVNTVSKDGKTVSGFVQVK